jgi:hypothetical protein
VALAWSSAMLMSNCSEIRAVASLPALSADRIS